jgi:hypothetical protein
MAQHPWNPKGLTAYHSSWRGTEASLVNAGGLEKMLGGVAQKTLIAAATIKKYTDFGVDVDRWVKFRARRRTQLLALLSSSN